MSNIVIYQHTGTTDGIEIRHLIVEHSTVEIPLTLADQQHCLRFVGTHFFDLKTVLMAAK